MTVKRITERVASAFQGGRVDREAGVIHDVLICGRESKNGRDYLPGCFGDGKQYEGRVINVNHSEKGRQVQDRLGWFSNVTIRSDGLPIGKFNIIKSHPVAEQTFETAERNPALLGFSHVARCKTGKRKNGREQIESVQEVESIDLVADPATTHGFYESTEIPMKLNTLVSWLSENKATAEQIDQCKKLCEMDGMGEVEMPATPTSADDAVGGAFKSAMHSIIDMYPDKLDAQGVLGKLKEVMKAHGKLTENPDAKPAETPVKKDDAAEESKKAKAESEAMRESIALATTHKLPVEKITLLAKIEDKATRESIAEEFATAQLGGEKPKSGGREKPTTEGQTDPKDLPPTDGKKFVEHLKKK